MEEPSGDLSQSREKQNNPHRKRAIVVPHGSAPFETQELTQGLHSQSKPMFRCNTKERLDSKAISMLSSYLDKMVARRGSLEVISAQPKQISLDFLRPDFLRGPQLAQDEESNILGDSLNDFFNMVPDTPPPKSDNDEIWKQSQKMRESWMTAGNDFTSLPEAPNKQTSKQEANAKPAANYLDDLRILIDLVAEPPSERTYHEIFKPTITRSLNDKAALEVILSPAPHAKCEENKANIASLATGIDNQPCTPLATERSQNSQCQGAFGQHPTISCSRELTCSSHSLHYNTVSDQQSVFDSLPCSVKIASTVPSQVHVTVFPPRLATFATTISLDRYSRKGPCRASLPEMLEPLYAEDSIPGDCLFPQFGKLNKITRKMIFVLARPASRFVELSVCASTRSIYSTAAVPSLLHACKDSREVALSWYRLSFSNQEFPFPKVYFDFTRDGIYTRCRGCIGANCRHKKTLTEEHEKIKLVAFEAPMSFKPFRKIARFYPAVEHLVLIKGKSSIARGEIAWEEFNGVGERFFWQGKGEDLLGLYDDLLRDMEPRLVGQSRLRIVERMTLPGVVGNAEQVSAGGEGMWSCCR